MELGKWFEFELSVRQITDWIPTGQPYEMALWGPVLAPRAMLGDLSVQSRLLPDQFAELPPTVVIANPIIYHDEELPLELQGGRSTPYFWDGPEAYVESSVRFGFGPHGLESRVVGATVDEFVAAAQREMSDEVARLLSDE
eukprot:SAG11_NODE_2104_length_3818_cov_4.175316_3_plen_141_part_00